MDTGTAAVTVNVAVFEVMAPEAAVIFTVPDTTPVARPAVLIVATAVPLLPHDAVDVRVCVLPSVYVPTAAYCCVVPLAMLAVAGVT